MIDREVDRERQAEAAVDQRLDQGVDLRLGIVVLRENDIIDLLGGENQDDPVQARGRIRDRDRDHEANIIVRENRDEKTNRSRIHHPKMRIHRLRPNLLIFMCLLR